MSAFRIPLGAKVRDVVSGLEGIAVARTEWLNGCVRITFKPALDKDGKSPDCVCEDEQYFELIAADRIALPGDAPTPAPPATQPLREPAFSFDRPGGGRDDRIATSR